MKIQLLPVRDFVKDFIYKTIYVYVHVIEINDYLLDRLFGFVTITSDVQEKQRKFACHVFECNVSADDICAAMATANKMAFKELMEQKAKAYQEVMFSLVLK